MIYFPLQVPVLLITCGGKFIGKILNANKECLKVVDIIEVITSSDQVQLSEHAYITGTFYFDRSNIVGYKTLLDNDIYKHNDELTNNNLLTLYNSTIRSKNQNVIHLVQPNNKTGE